MAGLLVKSESAGLVNWKNSTQGSLLCLTASIHKNLKHLTKVGHEFFSFKGTLALCSLIFLMLSVNANTRGVYTLKARHKSKRMKRLRGKNLLEVSNSHLLTGCVSAPKQKWSHIKKWHLGTVRGSDKYHNWPSHAAFHYPDTTRGGKMKDQTGIYMLLLLWHSNTALRSKF